MPEFPREFGEYTLLAELGRGGMGVVFHAVQKSLGRPVALKLLNVSRDWASDETLQRFQREGEIMARLAHPDIVTVHDFGVHEERVFIAMELVRGSSLDEFVRSRKPPRESLLEIVAKMARALHHAHGLGVVHRDVKPSNILVDAEGRPKLTDFGVAKVEGVKLSVTGGIMGTPAYMSPEQAAGLAVDARTDVYSLGAVLYEILTGAAPFSATNFQAVLAQILNTEPPPPRLLDPDLPRDVETVCLKAMEKRREDRYPTALAFAEDLERCARGDAILARPTGIAERTWRWSRRRPGFVAAAVLFAIMASAIAAIAVRLRTRENLDAVASEADALFRRQAWDSAGSLYRRLGDRADARLRLAICLQESGKGSEAEREYAAYLNAAPGDAGGWRHRGRNALDRGDLAAALAHYRQAAKAGRVPVTEEAERFGDYDVIVALVERHFAPIEPLFARPDLASCSPHYHFGRRVEFGVHFQIQIPDFYESLSEWSSRFPIPSYRDIDIDTWIRKYGEHPVLLGWRASARLEEDPSSALADLDRAIASIPISRWLRYLRFRALYALRQLDRADAESEALRQLCPFDVYTRRNIALCRRMGRDFLRSARDFEWLVQCDEKGRASTGTPTRWYEQAARCAALGRDVRETVRLLRASGTHRPSDLARDRDFAAVWSTPEFQDYLDSLDPYLSAFAKAVTQDGPFDPWLGFPPRSWARYRLAINEKSYDVTVRLVESDASRFTMSVEILDGAGGAQRTMLPDLPRRAPPASGDRTERIGERLCRTADWPVPGGTVRLWWSDDVPFRLVRKSARTPARSVTVELLDFGRE